MNESIFAYPWMIIAVAAVALAVMLIAVWGKDDNDRKLERMERERAERLCDRMADDGDEASILNQVYTEPETPAVFEKWLRYYQFDVTMENGETYLIDRRHFGLKNHRLKINTSRQTADDESWWKKTLAAARTNMNRRAQRAGVYPKKTRASRTGGV